MELGDILQTMWKRAWLIVLGTLLSAAVTWAASINMEPTYRAKVTIMVNQASEMPLADLSSLSRGERLAQTYSELLKTRPLLEIVIANLNLDLTPGTLANEKIATNLVPGTQLLELTVQDPDPRRASDIANEIVFTFISTHNSEKQLEGIVQIEQDITAEMADLKELIQGNRALLSRQRMLGMLPEGEPNPLESTLASQQDAYATLLGSYLAVRRLQTQLLDVTIVEPAIPPRNPIRPNVPLYTLIGTFIGMNCGVGLAFLLENLDRTLKTRDDVRQVLSLPTLGSIPKLQGKQRRSDLTTSVFPYSPASEAYRTLRTNIRFAGVDETLETLLITSAEPGEGKTYVSINLSIACAQAGLQVVLVDMDLRRPKLHRSFGLDNRVGLTDLLVGDLQNVQECMLETEISNLRLIASGSLPPNPSELLASKRMETVLAQVRQSAQMVILDTPPLMAVTDAAVLAQKVDGVLLVVYAGKTRREIIQHAVEHLLQVRVNPIGIVLNAVSTGKRSYYYYSQHREEQRKQRRWLHQCKESLGHILQPFLKKQKTH